LIARKGAARPLAEVHLHLRASFIIERREVQRLVFWGGLLCRARPPVEDHLRLGAAFRLKRVEFWAQVPHLSAGFRVERGERPPVEDHLRVGAGLRGERGQVQGIGGVG